MTYTKTFLGEKGTKHADQRDSVASRTLYMQLVLNYLSESKNMLSSSDNFS